MAASLIDGCSSGFAPIRGGSARLHYVDTGPASGREVILMAHGFPDMHYSFRHQVPALVRDGWRVVVPDQLGYGWSSCPLDDAAYAQERLIQDLVDLLDHLGLRTVVLVGHDWGGSIVWNMALSRPDRVRAVCGIVTPCFPVPKRNPLPKMKANPGRFEYQLYFDEQIAVDELNRDVERSLRFFQRSSKKEDRLPVSGSFSGIAKRGGLLAGQPEVIPRSSMLTEDDLSRYVRGFSVNKFDGALRWYRNVERNWEWTCRAIGHKAVLDKPALMVTAGRDFILQPAMSAGMESFIPRLSRGHIHEAGHWIHCEQAPIFNEILLRFLRENVRGSAAPFSVTHGKAAKM